MLDFENGKTRIFRRIIARRAKIALDEFVAGEPTLDQAREFKQIEDDVLNGPLGQRLYIETARRISESDVEKRVDYLSMAAKANGKEFLLLVDSLQKLPVENLSDRRAGIDRWLRFFEYIRDQYDITILVTSELKRPQEGQIYKPTEVSLKESGDIEYSADVVIALDRASGAGDLWIDDAPEKQPISCRIVFNRDGASGRLRKDLLLVHPTHAIVEVEAQAPMPERYQR
jgi:hypothetical protein